MSPGQRPSPADPGKAVCFDPAPAGTAGTSHRKASNPEPVTESASHQGLPAPPAAWHDPLPGARVKDACGAAARPFDPPARSRGMQAQARLPAWSSRTVSVSPSLCRHARPSRSRQGCARGGCRWPCADYRADAGLCRGRYQADRRPARCSGWLYARRAGPACAAPAWPRPGTGLVAQPALVRALAPGAAPLVGGLRSEGSRVGGTQLAGGVHAAGRASGLRRCSEGQP